MKLSSTPVEDLLRARALGREHPDKWVQEAVKDELSLLNIARRNDSSHWVKTSPSQQQAWESGWWDKFDDVEGYRNTKSEILDGFKLLNDYLLQWMRNEFLFPAVWRFIEDDLSAEERAGLSRRDLYFVASYVSKEEWAKLSDILDAFGGAWGIRTCYDYVGTGDPASDDVNADWKRIPPPYPLYVPATAHYWQRTGQKGRRKASGIGPAID